MDESFFLERFEIVDGVLVDRYIIIGKFGEELRDSLWFMQNDFSVDLFLVSEFFVLMFVLIF